MKRILFTWAVLIISTATFAQTSSQWKKTVYRVVDIAPVEDTLKHHLTDVTYDTTLIEFMVNAIKAGKLTAYNTFNGDFTTRLTLAQLTQMTDGATDTIIVVDPVTNAEKQMIVHRDFDPTKVHKYRLLEEWTFNPHSGKTDIQIKGIAPIKDVYGEDGTFRGVQGMFWIHYTDAQKVLAAYDHLHPTKTFGSYIWDDYFYSDVKPAESK